MSYIRSTENPEGLYIWGDGTFVNISQTDVDYLIKIPDDVWHTTCQRYTNELGDLDDEPIEYKGFKIEETGDWKIKITYDDDSIVMWPVTWYEITSRYRVEAKE